MLWKHLKVGISACGKYNNIIERCTTDFTVDSDVMTPEELNQQFHDEQDKFDNMDAEEVSNYFQKKEVAQSIQNMNDDERERPMTIDEI